MSRSIIATYGHVTRRLKLGLPLKGRLLQVALDAVGSGDADRDGIVSKLTTGERLDDYELHLMLDMWLLHARLAARAEPPLNS
jgi:hypothetical protein